MNILFYGNCQLDVIKRVLNLDTNIFPNQTSILCFNTELTEQEMKHYVQTSDVIIMNHIHDKYRDKDYLSTTYIIQHAKKSCKIILISNCYFVFYYFDVKSMIGEYEITPYHDINLYDCYKQKRHSNYYINN